jgi:hypothetical protein
MSTRLFGEKQAKRGLLRKANLRQARQKLSESKEIEIRLIREFFNGYCY